jgi:1-acyl-sn-glycerol-3-phosphate acyltransferase
VEERAMSDARMNESTLDVHSAPAAPSLVRRLYENVAMLIGWPLFALLCMWATIHFVVLLPTALIIGRQAYHLRARRIGAKVFIRFIRYLQVTGLARFDLRAIDTLIDEPNIILAPNHPSLLDAVLVVSRLNTATCIMKAKISSNPVLGIGARLMGYVPNDSPATMVKQSVAVLQSGGQLLLFPEGTRTVVGNINPLKGSVALVAKKSGCPVQTLFIESNSPFLGKHWPVFKRPNFPLHYRVRLGQRFDSMDDKQAFLAQLEAHYRSEVGKRDR